MDQPTTRTSPQSLGAYTIRRATLDDIDALVDLRCDLQTEFGLADAADLMPANRDYFERKLPTDDLALFLAESAAQIVATGAIVMYEGPPRPSSPNGLQGYIVNMYTVPEHRGRGIAAAIVDQLIDHARSRNTTRVWLRTAELARPIYQRAGFREDNDYMKLAIE